MRLSTFLPILAAAENKQKVNEKEEKKSVERFLPQGWNRHCSNQIPKLGGNFEATNNGSSGTVNLTDYPDGAWCKHIVRADRSCKKIHIQYRSVAVQASRYCPWVGFRFGWVDENAEDLDHMAEHMAHGAPVRHPTLFEAFGFDLGTIRKLMIRAIFSKRHWLRQVNLVKLRND